MSLKKRLKADPSFSMASMSDMVFLLLIFFLVTSTMINPNALNLLLPKSTNQVPAKRLVSVSVQYNETGTAYVYHVDLQEVPFSSIETLVQQKLMNTEDPTLSIYAEASVPIEEVVRIMNIAKKNKYKAILATSPE